ncbi:toxin [Candidatus Amesbacteria bacterium]|nr:toxin [Candidatus Amesbacteria bacterium]
MKYKYDFSSEKDEILKETRGLGFRDIIEAIKKGSLLDDVKHFNRDKYPKQRIYIVRLNNKIYAIPYVKDHEKKVIFLKTIYPNTKLKVKYIK